jgi:hypothetical protein
MGFIANFILTPLWYFFLAVGFLPTMLISVFVPIESRDGCGLATCALIGLITTILVVCGACWYWM